MGKEEFVIYLEQWELNNKLIVHVFCILKYRGQLTWFYSFSYEARWQFNHLGYELQVYIWQHVIDLLSNFICKMFVTETPYTVNWVCSHFMYKSLDIFFVLGKLDGYHHNLEYCVSEQTKIWNLENLNKFMHNIYCLKLVCIW